MATLDIATRADLQGDLGVGTDEEVFTDAELDRHWTRTEQDYEQTVVYALRQILASGRKFEAWMRNQGFMNKQESKRASRYDVRVTAQQQLETQLQRWERLSGLSGARLEAGTLDLNIDQDDEDV